jgi:hypothetical protein
MLDYRLMFALDVRFGSKADIACAALADNAHNDEIRDNVAKRMRRQPTPFRQRIPVGLGTVRSATKAMQTQVFISSEPERGGLSRTAISWPIIDIHRANQVAVRRPSS